VGLVRLKPSRNRAQVDPRQGLEAMRKTVIRKIQQARPANLWSPHPIALRAPCRWRSG